MDDLPDTCDFCNLSLDEDEELTPLHVDESPEPKPIVIEGFDELTSHDTFDRSAEGRALINAMEQSDNAELTLNRGVEVIERVGDSIGQYESTYDEHKVSARVKVRPYMEDRSPDAMVCETCADMFKNLG